MTNLKLLFGLLLVLLSLFSSVNCQDWKKIVPIRSKCVDVKKVFHIAKCNYPVTDFERPDFKINITFAERQNKWNVSGDTVVQVIIVLKRLIPIEEFESNCNSYRIKPDSDIPSGKIYSDDENGIEFATQKLMENKEFVTSIRRYPKKSKMH